LTQDRRGFDKQHLAGRRRPYTAWISMQKRDTEHLLELGDLLAERRLSNMNLDGRAREAARFNDFTK
jgi:hypothetical protein